MAACLDRPKTFVPDRPRPQIPFFLFARSHLGVRLYPWQVEILRAVEHKRVSAVVCNGGGKSSVLLPTLVLGFLFNWPAGRVALTSGTYAQIETAVWPGIERFKHLSYFKDWTFNHLEILTPQSGFARGFSNDKADSLEGWHKDPQSPVLYICDEAKAIPDAKYVGIKRCRPTFYIQVSSACPARGEFYHSFNKYKSLFYTVKVKSTDCPHITDRERAEDSVALDRAVFRMKHLSEFDEDLSNSAISMALINQALSRQITMHHHPNPGARCAFCDFAAGGDFNVLALRDGNKVEIIHYWKDRDTTQACRLFIEHFKRLKLHASEIFGDAGGLGQVMCNNLKDAGWPIVEVNNGAAAEDDVHYSNRGSEIWFKAIHEIEFGKNGQHIIIPDDKLFIEQATNRKREYDAKQRLRIESKKDMAANNIQSPDLADAVFGAMVCRPSQWNAQRVAQVHLPKNPFAPGFVRF